MTTFWQHALLKTALGSEWSASLEHKLLTGSGAGSGTTLDDWLRNSFFEQHCKRFHNRPFIWHLWDGRKDGFSCLVNYHKLDHKALENSDLLLPAGLDQRPGCRRPQRQARGRPPAGRRPGLQDKLKLILAGEPPYDIFVRWKPLAEQPIGWNPDLNDGVRMNIRPFVEAGVSARTRTSSGPRTGARSPSVRRRSIRGSGKTASSRATGLTIFT